LLLGSACALLLQSAASREPDPFPTSAALGAASSASGFSASSIRPAYGLLWLQIDPDDVEIALDGQYLDKDVWLVSVAPGSHVLRVSKPGYESQNSHFGISSGQNVRLDLRLSPVAD
jgi:hypothetical protein